MQCSIFFSPDGQRVAEFDKSCGIGVWDTRYGNLGASFSPDESQILITSLSWLRILDVSTGTTVQFFSGDFHSARFFSRGNEIQIVSGGGDGMLRVMGRTIWSSVEILPGAFGRDRYDRYLPARKPHRIVQQ